MFVVVLHLHDLLGLGRVSVFAQDAAPVLRFSSSSGPGTSLCRWRAAPTPAVHIGEGHGDVLLDLKNNVELLWRLLVTSDTPLSPVRDFS